MTNRLKTCLIGTFEAHNQAQHASNSGAQSNVSRSGM